MNYKNAIEPEYEDDTLLAHSLEAEQAVLGSVLIEANGFMVVRDLLVTESFYTQKNKDLFEAMDWLFAHGVQPDVLTVWQRLEDTGKNQEIGMGYLSALSDHAPHSANVSYYAEIVRDKYIRRSYWTAIQEMLNTVKDPDKTGDQLVSDGFQKLLELDCFAQNKSTAKQAGSALRKEVEERQGKALIGVTTGFDELDEITRGFAKNSMITLGAATATGKTTFLLNMATRMAQKGAGVLYISLEVPDVDLMETIVPGLSDDVVNFTYDEMLSTSLSESQIETMQTLIDRANDLPIYFTWNTYSIPEILMTIEYHKRKYNIDFVIIDHIQLVEETADYKEFVKQTSMIKRFCNKKKIPILNVSQLNSNLKSKAHKEPDEYDLRGGGNLPQDSDIIMFLYKLDRDDDEVYMKMHKNRKGKVGKPSYLEVIYDGDHKATSLKRLASRPEKQEVEESFNADTKPKTRKRKYAAPLREPIETNDQQKFDY